MFTYRDPETFITYILTDVAVTAQGYPGAGPRKTNILCWKLGVAQARLKIHLRFKSLRLLPRWAPMPDYGRPTASTTTRPLFSTSISTPKVMKKAVLDVSADAKTYQISRKPEGVPWSPLRHCETWTPRCRRCWIGGTPLYFSQNLIHPKGARESKSFVTKCRCCL